MELIELSVLLADHTEPAFVVDGLLPCGGLSLLVGDPKVGKSVFARNLLLAVSRGRPFLERATSQGACLYYPLEEITSQVRRSFHNLGATNEPIWCRFGPVTAIDITEQLQADIATTSATMIVIDPLFDALAVADENAYASVNRAVKSMVHLARKTGCHIMLVHHANKAGYRGGRGILGSQALRGATDTNIFYTATRRGRRYIETEQRYGTPIPYTPLDFNSITEQLTVSETTTMEKRMYEALTDGMTTRIWLDAVKGGAKTKLNAIHALCDAGLVVAVTNGSRVEFHRRESMQ